MLEGRLGKMLVGRSWLSNFTRMLMLKTTSKFPWQDIEQIGANVSGRKIKRHFEIYTKEAKFLLASKDSGKILKIAHVNTLGNDKIVKLPSLDPNHRG
ncbi:MAG: DUF956 family protein [Streptococcus parasanguinis]